MKLIIGILIFVLGILNFEFSIASTNTSNNSVGLTQQSILSTPEILEKDYVELEVSDTNSVSFSVLQTFREISQMVHTRYLSLLNWQSKSRRNLEIENYDRKAQFGRWINDPNDDVCFNTRAKVLVRDSVNSVVFKDSNHCAVEKGTWKDPYTTATVKESKAIQIDHFVPLKNAYMSGAHKWSFKARCLYANFLGNEFHLLSVDGIQNMKKGDRSPAKYMPPNKEYSCTYVRNWLAVKFIWGLTMTIDEATAIRGIILDNNCSLSKFRMTERELLSQRQFAKDNIDLCEKIDQSAGK